MDNKDKSINFLAEMANFTFISKYARYDEKKQRRETWEEAISRLEKMHLKKFSFLSKENIEEIKWAFEKVKEKLVVPSMRSLQFGGKAIEAHNARIFNCSCRHVDSIRSFSEIFYLLLCGCGVDIGLSEQFISRLPDLVEAEDKTGTIVAYCVNDTIEGWADSVEALLNCYFRNTAYTGRKIVFDYSRIRKKGELLKTGGGKAPGYKGLKNTHEKIKQLLDHIIEEKDQKRLKTINIYDILMFCADAVLSGGIRRAATSVTFDILDDEMMNAKTFFIVDKYRRFSKDNDTQLYYGQVLINKKIYDVELNEFDFNQLKEKNIISWIYIEPQRARSNNSVRLMRNDVTLEQFKNIIDKTKQFGEPGFIFSDDNQALSNPCREISFIPVTKDGRCGVQFCNLTAINGAKILNKSIFEDAVKAATIIGTLQASYTHFPYLSNTSKELTEEEALLGVSITGLMENPDILLNPELQKEMSSLAKNINKIWSKKININQAARVTCIKPEGTSSIILETSSGIHPHHAKRYFRRIQCNKIDNVYKFFKKYNPHATEESEWSATKTDDVIIFPISVPDKSIVKSDLNAIKHLEYIKSTQENWVSNGTTEVNKKLINHSVSCTIMVNENEWDNVIKFIFNNKIFFSAISLIPAHGDKIYKQSPMESIMTENDEKRWQDLISKWNSIDYKCLIENDDKTSLQEEIVCAGGACLL